MVSSTSNDNKNFMNDKTYGFLKNLVQLFLPAFSTLYLSLAGLWHLPYAQQVVGTAAALATFLGVLLRISTKAYNANEANYDGSMVVTTNEEGVQVYSLELNGDPADMAGKSVVSFKVGAP